MKLFSSTLLFICLISFNFYSNAQDYILYGVKNFDEVEKRLDLTPDQVSSVGNILKERDSRFKDEFLSLASPDQIENEKEMVLFKEALIRKKAELDREAATKMKNVLSEEQLKIYFEMMRESMESLRNL